MNPLSRRKFLWGVGGAALAIPFMDSLAMAATKPVVAKRMAHFYVPIGVVRRGFFPGEQDHIIPEGNLGNVMKSLGKQNPKFFAKKLESLTPTLRPLESIKNKVTLIRKKYLFCEVCIVY